MKFETKTFTKEEIHLDFNEFINCKFIECNIIYHGYGLVRLNNNSFENCRHSFSDSAAKTLNFMSAIYFGGGKQLIEDTIKNITTGQYLKV